MKRDAKFSTRDEAKRILIRRLENRLEEMETCLMQIKEQKLTTSLNWKNKVLIGIGTLGILSILGGAFLTLKRTSKIEE